MQEPTSTTASRGRPKTTYYHNGIGGRGNYHKRSDESDTKQRRPNFAWAFAALFSSCSSNSNVKHTAEESSLEEDLPDLKGSQLRESHLPSRWFNGIGGFGNRRTRRQQSPGSDMSCCTTVTSEYSPQPLPLGVADLMRRKILGEKSAAKKGDEQMADSVPQKHLP